MLLVFYKKFINVTNYKTIKKLYFIATTIQNLNAIHYNYFVLSSYLKYFLQQDIQLSQAQDIPKYFFVFIF